MGFGRLSPRFSRYVGVTQADPPRARARIRPAFQASLADPLSGPTTQVSASHNLCKRTVGRWKFPEDPPPPPAAATPPTVPPVLPYIIRGTVPHCRIPTDTPEENAIMLLTRRGVHAATDAGDSFLLAEIISAHSLLPTIVSPEQYIYRTALYPAK